MKFTDLTNKLQHPKVMLSLLVIISAAISIQNYLVLPASAGVPGQESTLYSNFLIFRNSFFHLIHQQDLYAKYDNECLDLFKYSPSFALLMAPLAIFPDLLGLFLWNFLNVFVLFFALSKLPVTPEKKKVLMLLFVLLEAITAMQNSQSNSLVAGLLILTFLFLEKNNSALAALMIVMTVFIKLFGLMGCLLFLFYPDKLKSFLWSAFWFLLFTFLPLVVVSPIQLLLLYKSWLQLLESDHSISFGLSVMSLLNTWFGVSSYKNLVVGLGLIVLLMPILRIKQFKSSEFRLQFLASILIWVVIFNHKSESPTFVIAVSGIAIWYFTGEKQLIKNLLLIITLIFTVLSPTDLFPAFIRNDYFIPYMIKVLPCMLVWFNLIYDLLNRDYIGNKGHRVAEITNPRTPLA